MSGGTSSPKKWKILGKAGFNALWLPPVNKAASTTILKPNMVLPGLACPHQKSVEEVADATIGCLLRSVPGAVQGVVFLSGGQPGELASARLNAMNVRYKSRLPWEVSFSFGRAIQEPALEIWHGKSANVIPAQEALYHRAKCDRTAHLGRYDAAIEADHRECSTSKMPSTVYAGSTQ